MEGVATAKAPDSQLKAAPDAMPAQRLSGILGTRGRKPAAAGKQGWDQYL